MKAEDIIDEVNDSGDGVIRYDEFLRAMMDLGSGDVVRGVHRVKNISRAYEFTSQGSFSLKGSSSWKLGRRRSQGETRGLDRGWQTPDRLGDLESPEKASDIEM